MKIFNRISMIILAINLGSGPIFASLVNNSTHPMELYSIVSEQDKLAGTYITSMYKSLRRRRHLDLTHIKRMEKSLHKDSAFMPFKIFIPVLKGLNVKNKTLFLEKCLQNQSLNFNQEILTIFKNRINRYCMKKIITFDSKDFNSNNNFPLFIKNNLKIFLDKYHIKKFTKWIRKLSKEDFLYYQLSRTISDYYSNSQTMPNSTLIKEIKASRNLNSLIKNGNINKGESHKLVKREIRDISKRFFAYLKQDKKKEYIDLLNKTVIFYKGHLENIKPSFAIKKILRMTNSIILKDNIEEAVKVLKKMHKVSPEKYKDSILFQIVRAYLLKEDFRSIEKIIKEFKLLENFEKMPEKIRFWVSYTLKKMGKPKLAFNYYQKIIDSSVLSFYSILAQRELKFQKLSNNQNIQEVSFNSKTLSIKKILENQMLKSHITRILTWSKVGNKTFLKKDINHLLNLKQNNFTLTDSRGVSPIVIKRELIYFLAKNFNRKSNYLNTFKLIHNSISAGVLNLNAYNLKFLFPFQYISKIKQIDDSMDPLIVLSLIRQESAFNPSARSVVGARGLMQLMPSTAKMLRKSVSISQLKKPQINLSIGIKYLKNLITKYEGNLIFALAAYNAGERRLNGWVEKVFTSENPLIVIESIPFKETRNYVKLIYRNIFFYRILTDSYNKMPIEESFKIAYAFE